MKRKPSKLWYLAATAIAVVGTCSAVTWGVSSVTDVADRARGFVDAEIPGEAVVSVDEPSGLMVFYEATDVDPVPDVEVTVTDPSGRDVAVERYSLDVRYDADDRVGRGIATFDAETPGAYKVSVLGSAPSGSEFTVGESFAAGIAAVLGAVALLGIAILTSIGITVYVAFSRSRRSPSKTTAPNAPARAA